MIETVKALASERTSVNEFAAPLVAQLIGRADEWRLGVRRTEAGVTIVDAGIGARGCVAAGIAIGEICLGGLGRVRLASASRDGGWPTWIEVASSHPVLACLASQYAGWSLSASKEEGGGRKFFSLGSGPARALACREPLFEELGYRDRVGPAVLVLEVDRAPPQVVIDKILRDCGLEPSQLTLVLTPTTSLAGSTQVVARVLEVALHKAHELGFALGDIVDGSARAPLPAPSPDAGTAMGRTNDAILYGGQVHLTVAAGDDAARELAEKLPPSTSRDYGRSFADIFRDYDYDFYRIDGALFAPAEVWVSSLASGRTWHAGKLDMGLLQRLWMDEA